MAEKTCPPLPQHPGLDWQNIRTKCPCCGTAVKLVLSWKAEGLQLELMPEATADQNLQHQPSHQTNSSLMNIVSVSADNRVNEQPAPHSSNGQQSGSTGVVNLDDDSHEPQADDSNSSSQSADSQSQNVSTSSNKQLQCNATPADMMVQSLQTQMQVSSHGLAVGAAGKDVPPVSQIFQPFHLPQTDGSFKCQFEGCGIAYNNVQQLELHYKRHKGEKIQQCEWPACSRLFSSKEKLLNHVRCRHTGERPYRCMICDKAFTSPKHLKDHSLLHTNERPFQCDWAECSRRFRRRHHLVAHMRVHTKERPFGCMFPGCDMRFTKAHHVKRHQDTHIKYRGPVAYAVTMRQSTAAATPSTLTAAMSSAGLTTAAGLPAAT